MVAAALLSLTGWAPAQDNGSTTRHAGPESRDPDTRNSASRPASDLDAAIAELRKAQTIAAAALSARAAYALGDDAKRTLLDLCREKSLPDATFQGIVGAFEFERDQSILPVLMDLYASADPARERYLTERFRALDVQRSMLADLFAELEKAPGAARRRTLLRVISVVVDTPAERMQAARFLVQAFQRAEFREFTDEITGTLQKITFQRYTQPARWQKWLDEFAPANPEGFTEADLYRSALRERDERLIVEVRRAINVAIANKQIPDYFNPTQYPESAIRSYAAQECAGLKDAEADVVKTAARTLTQALKAEKHEEVLCALLKSLGVLSENNPEVKDESAPSILPYLRDRRDSVVLAALKALSQAGRPTDAQTVEDLYEESGAGDLPAVRAQIVTTLYSLESGSCTIDTALEDGAPEVRASAARGLGYGKRKDAAPAIAKALRIEKSEETQRVMVGALAAIQAWPPEAIDALLDIAARPGAAREAAVRGLIQADGNGSVDAERGDRVLALLSEALPVLGAAPDKRKVLLDALQAAKGRLSARVLLRWLRNENQVDAQREIATVLTRVAPPNLEELDKYARDLIGVQKPAAAVVILRAAVDHAAGVATTTQSGRNGGLRIALARALLLERTLDGLAEAETIASQELKLKPEDGQLLLLRGNIREALGRRFDAADDLRRALRSEGVAMADPDRQDAERKTAQWLLAEDPKKAKEFLDGLPPLPRSRDFLIVHGRCELELGNVRQSVALFRAALNAPGKEDSNIVRYQLADALLRSARSEDRLEAKALFDVLQGEPGLPAEYSLEALAGRVRADSAARAAVRALDVASRDEVASSLAAVIALGDRALPWLFHQLPDVARTEPPSTIERRITAAQSILFPEAGSSRPPVLTPPATEAPRAAWIDFATGAAAWWDRRS